MIKKYLRQACGVEKHGNIPTVLKSEFDYLLDLTCGIINKIPYCVTKGNAMVTLAPADMLFSNFKHEYLPSTKSKLRSINDMIDNLKEHQELVRKIRNDQLTMELERANKEMKKEGNIEGNIIPSVGDLVLIRSDAKDSSFDKYGVIQAILNPQTLKIRTRGGMIDRPTSITIPIVA